MMSNWFFPHSLPPTDTQHALQRKQRYLLYPFFFFLFLLSIRCFWSFWKKGFRTWNFWKKGAGKEKEEEKKNTIQSWWKPFWKKMDLKKKCVIFWPQCGTWCHSCNAWHRSITTCFARYTLVVTTFLETTTCCCYLPLTSIGHC